MSRAKDRARAESGLIFRDGHLVKKEDWYKAHPTKEMLREQQTVVDYGVKGEMAKLFPKKQEIVQPDKVIEVPEEQPYFCSICNRTHRVGTKIYEKHIAAV